MRLLVKLAPLAVLAALALPGVAQAENGPVTGCTYLQAEEGSCPSAEPNPEVPVLTPATASAAFKAVILQEHPNAVFPSHEGRFCPEIYPGEVTETEQQSSVCFAEFTTGDVWNLVSATAFEGSPITFSEVQDSRWHRRWTRCQIHSGGQQNIHGTLTSNNACKGPQTDAYFIEQESYYAGKFQFRPGGELGWQFTQSAGFNSLGIFHGSRHGHTYTFTNAVGDSFRYTPYD